MRRRGHARSGEAGFTLIEVLAALALSAMALTVAVQGVRLVVKTAGKSTAAIDRLDMIARGVAAVREDLARMEHVWEMRRGGRAYVFRGEARSLSFVVSEPPFPADPGTYAISYDIRSSGQGSQLLRSREAYEPGARRERTGRADSEAVVVLEGGYRFAFSYLERAEGRVRWLDRWTDRRRLPGLVRLEVTSLGVDEPAVPALVVRPGIDAELSCLSKTRDPCSPLSAGALAEAREAPRAGGDGAPAAAAGGGAKTDPGVR